LKIVGKLDARRAKTEWLDLHLSGITNQEGRMESNKQPWEPMRLTYVGHAAEIIQQGGGKGSRQDDGDGRKPPGQG
jgi:hypothetical protein